MADLTYDELVFLIGCAKDHQDRLYRKDSKTAEDRADISMCTSILGKLDERRRSLLRQGAE